MNETGDLIIYDCWWLLLTTWKLCFLCAFIDLFLSDCYFTIQHHIILLKQEKNCFFFSSVSFGSKWWKYFLCLWHALPYWISCKILINLAIFDLKNLSSFEMILSNLNFDGNFAIPFNIQMNTIMILNSRWFW